VTHPERLAKEVAVLDRHANVAVVGGWVHFVEENTGDIVFDFTPPSAPDLVRKGMFFNLTLSHTSSMIRTATLARVGLYSTAYPAAEDYELMRRINVDHDISNVPEFVADYRISSRGISVLRRRRQLFDRLRIQLKYFRPVEWRAWAGALQTLVLFFVPRRVLVAAKAVVSWFIGVAAQSLRAPRRLLRTLPRAGVDAGKVWGGKADPHSQ
jgi:hypothetical protein